MSVHEPGAAGLAVARPWFRVRDVPGEPGVRRIDEPHVDEFVRGNIWHLRGADRDLVVDAGMGLGSLRDEVPALFEHDPVLVVTHIHPDHFGGAGEFDDRRMHPAELAHPALHIPLRGREVEALLGTAAVFPDLLIDALPHPGFDLDAFAVTPVSTRPIEDSERIELGDRTLVALLSPGHTPGGICLYDPHDRILFSGDVLYDDDLLDDLPESDPAAYRDSLRRLRGLDVRLVLPGHGAAFDGDRMRMLIDRYLDG